MKFIAEFCQNHNGQSDVLFRMIDEAKKSGATHAKIQGLYSSELVFREEFEVGRNGSHGLVRPFTQEVTRLEKLDLSPEIEREFVERCIQTEITPMITVFSHSGLNRAVEAGFKSFKVASYDCGSRALISRILPQAEELVVSTGATKWDDVLATAALIRSSANSETKVAFLHARSVYPTPLKESRLSRMLALASLGFDFGLSDHSAPEADGLDSSLLAIWMGASVIERHFTILKISETKDGPVSLTPEQFELMVDFANNDAQEKTKVSAQILSRCPQAVLSPSLNPDATENAMAAYYRGRVASWVGPRQCPSWEDWPADEAES